MTDRERLDSFLEEFRDLENKLAELAGGGDGGFTSYSRSLQKVYKYRKSPVVLAGDNYTFLKSCGELRNLVTHNNDVCYPTPECYERFMELSRRIRFPKRAIDIATSGKKLLTCKLETNLLKLTARMVSMGLSHVPVLDGERVRGVFSSSTIFDRFNSDGGVKIDEDTAVGDFEEQIEFTAHSTETYLFAAPDSVLYEFAERVENRREGRRIAAVLVTSDGTRSGKLLGIITQSDLLKA